MKQPKGPALAVILARAGSKGVPGKNVREVGGRPCIAWTIEHAMAAQSVGLVAVSSDDPRALEVARAMGAVALRRSDGLATDTARVDDAAREAVGQVEGARGVLPAEHPVVILYANVPVRPEGLVDRAVGLLVTSGCDSVQSYQAVGKYHPWWTARVGEDGQVRPWEGDVLNHGVFRRQDLPPAFVPDGAVIVCTRRALFCGVGAAPGPHAFFGRDRRGVVNPEGSVVDIDSELDFLAAAATLEARRSSRPRTP